MGQQRGDGLDTGTQANGAEAPAGPDTTRANYQYPDTPADRERTGTRAKTDTGPVPAEPAAPKQRPHDGDAALGARAAAGGGPPGDPANSAPVNDGGETDADDADDLTAHQRREAHFDKIGVLGHAAWVLSASPRHRHFFVTDMEWMIMPAVVHDQYRIWRQGVVPVVFATWAFLGPEQEKRFESGITRLAPTEWKSGDSPWLVDLVAPFGGRDEAIEELKSTIFPDKPLRALDPDGSGKVVVL